MCSGDLPFGGGHDVALRPSLGQRRARRARRGARGPGCALDRESAPPSNLRGVEAPGNRTLEIPGGRKSISGQLRGGSGDGLGAGGREGLIGVI